MRVLKFGGSSLATPEKILSVARQLALIYKNEPSLIVVVSAMGVTTDKLLQLAYKVSSKPSSREMDMLVSTGERVTMALLCMALNDLNCPAISFTGSQAGIFTDGSHQDARITEVKPLRIEDSLKAKKIVVLAGFQGVDPNTKEITTLGRGGSDTTAVAMAAHFKAMSCEMYKDVDGIFTTDPKHTQDADLIPNLTWEQMIELCNKGAQVVHEKAVRLAMEKSVPLDIGNSETLQIGTRIGR